MTSWCQRFHKKEENDQNNLFNILKKKGSYICKNLLRLEMDLKLKHEKPQFKNRMNRLQFVAELRQISTVHETMINEIKKDLQMIDLEQLGQGIEGLFFQQLSMVYCLIKQLLIRKVEDPAPIRNRVEELNENAKRKQLSRQLERDKYDLGQVLKLQKERQSKEYEEIWKVLNNELRLQINHCMHIHSSGQEQLLKQVTRHLDRKNYHTVNFIKTIHNNIEENHSESNYQVAANLAQHKQQIDSLVQLFKRYIVKIKRSPNSVHTTEKGTQMEQSSAQGDHNLSQLKSEKQKVKKTHRVHANQILKMKLSYEQNISELDRKISDYRAENERLTAQVQYLLESVVHSGAMRKLLQKTEQNKPSELQYTQRESKEFRNQKPVNKVFKAFPKHTKRELKHKVNNPNHNQNKTSILLNYSQQENIVDQHDIIITYQKSGQNQNHGESSLEGRNRPQKSNSEHQRKFFRVISSLQNQKNSNQNDKHKNISITKLNRKASYQISRGKFPSKHIILSQKLRSVANLPQRSRKQIFIKNSNGVQLSNFPSEIYTKNCENQNGNKKVDKQVGERKSPNKIRNKVQISASCNMNSKVYDLKVQGIIDSHEIIPNQKKKSLTIDREGGQQKKNRASKLQKRTKQVTFHQNSKENENHFIQNRKKSQKTQKTFHFEPFSTQQKGNGMHLLFQSRIEMNKK